MTEASLTNEFCSTYSRVGLSKSDSIQTMRAVLKNEIKYECLCMPQDKRTDLSKDLCHDDI